MRRTTRRPSSVLHLVTLRAVAQGEPALGAWRGGRGVRRGAQPARGQLRAVLPVRRLHLRAPVRATALSRFDCACRLANPKRVASCVFTGQPNPLGLRESFTCTAGAEAAGQMPSRVCYFDTAQAWPDAWPADDFPTVTIPAMGGVPATTVQTTSQQAVCDAGQSCRYPGTPAGGCDGAVCPAGGVCPGNAPGQTQPCPANGVCTGSGSAGR